MLIEAGKNCIAQTETIFDARFAEKATMRVMLFRKVVSVGGSSQRRQRFLDSVAKGPFIDHISK